MGSYPASHPVFTHLGVGFEKPQKIVIFWVFPHPQYEKEFNKFLSNIYEKYDIDWNEINKEKKEIFNQYEIDKCYYKAKNLYNKICHIANRYKYGQNVYYDLKSFENEFNSAHLITPGKVAFKINAPKRKQKEIMEGNITGGASSIQNVQNMYKRNIELEEQEIQNIINTIKQKGAELLIGENYNEILYQYAKNKYGPDTAGMLDLAHEKRNDIDYIKDTIKLKNWNDPKVKLDKDYLVKKIGEQFMDFGFDINKIPGYFFKNSSEPSKRISKDSDFLSTIKSNKEKILKGEMISMKFPRYSNDKKSNLHFALGHIDIRNGYIDKEGNLHIKVYDTYDFNKENKTPLNQAGRNAMLKGELKPFFTIHDILIPKDIIDELWK